MPKRFVSLWLPERPAERRRRGRPLTSAKLAQWCGRYSPWTAPDGGAGGDGVIMESGGCAHLFGGEAALLTDMTGRLARAGLTAQAGLADTPAAAWALARFGGATQTGRIAPAGQSLTRLAPLPIAALRLQPKTVEELMRLGVGRIDDLCRMPRDDLNHCFGREATVRLDKALGRIGDPITPMQPPPEFRARLDFDTPIGHRADIADAAESLIERLSRWLAEQRRGARRFDLLACLADGDATVISVSCTQPTRDADHWRRLFAERLDHIDAGFGIDALILSTPHAEPFAIAEPQPARERDPADRTAQLLTRLRNRLGADSVHALAPGDAGEADGRRSPTPLRPSRLLPQPEPIETSQGISQGTSQEKPPRHFHWRRMRHRVTAVAGPERIVPECKRIPNDKGREAAPMRDYYRLDCAEGRSFWLYRETPPRRDPAAAPAWFMHGLF